MGRRRRKKKKFKNSTLKLKKNPLKKGATNKRLFPTSKEKRKTNKGK